MVELEGHRKPLLGFVRKISFTVYGGDSNVREVNTTLLPALAGCGTGLALIVAIGAQNAHVLRIGIEGRAGTVLSVVLVCALSDAVLITADRGTIL